MQDGTLHLPSWARTALGTPIPLYRKDHTTIGHSLLFIGGVHGDEPEGVRLAEDLLSWIQGALKLKKPLKDWILIPDINPDGSRLKQRMNGRGVDLNRNFPSKDWSPEAKGPRYFPGPHPGSEPEVQALVKLIQEERPQVIVHFHSWEPCVVYSGDGRLWAETIAQGTGYEVREDIGYPTPGSLGQYGSLDLGLPVICVEAQEGDVLDELWPRFGRGISSLLLEKRK
ncbi:MAG: succinylglutamate desuccinylase/aspartoacylase family protein [Bdellovibrionaceae bacterium]|nr:succinylglutamate desuccinylase/aspartoacylase family protein [Pseudobdellovibrionaceae bacterium]